MFHNKNFEVIHVLFVNHNKSCKGIYTGVGTNGNSNGLQNFGQQVGNATTDAVVQQTFGSPSPLLDNSGDTSD